MFKRQLRFFLHRWHRRLGLAAALIFVLVSISGLMLNHTGDLALAQHYPQSRIWLWPYPVQANRGFVLHDAVVYSSGEQVYLNQTPLTQCTPPVLGVAQNAQQLWVLCSAQLLFWQQGQLVENIASSLLGENLQAIAALEGRIYLQNNGHWQALDDVSLSLGNIQAVAPPILTQQILSVDYQQNRVISWQKVLQDLHSGRFFGAAGVYLVDIAALILVLLALSGFWIWYSRR